MSSLYVVLSWIHQVDEASTKNVDQLKQDNDRLRQEIQVTTDQLSKIKNNLDDANRTLEETLAQLNHEKATVNELKEKLEITEKQLQDKSQVGLHIHVNMFVFLHTFLLVFGVVLP